MKVKACVLDLDGTLLDSNKNISDRTIDILLRLSQSGIDIMIATARPPRAVSWLLPQSLHNVCSFIYYNGAIVHCPKHKYYLHQPIEAELSRELLEYCIQAEPDLDFSIEVEDQWYSLQEYDEKVIRKVRGRPEVKTLAELFQYSPTKIIISGSSLTDRIIEKYGSMLHILSTDRGRLTQISNKNVSKESGLLKLCELYGYSPEDVICFGDDINDLGLFQICGYSVAMENGIDELKQIATEVTLSNDAEGVAHVLERLYASNLWYTMDVKR